MIGMDESTDRYRNRSFPLRSRYGHLNKEGLLCTWCYLTRRRDHRHSIIRSYVAVSPSFSPPLSFSLSNTPSLCVSICGTSAQSTPSSINELASIYSLLHHPNPDFHVCTGNSPSHWFTRFQKKRGKKESAGRWIRTPSGMERGWLVVADELPRRYRYRRYDAAW